ncbi:MAG: hypothetical protein WC858_06305 [Parcubacteria group bacterium]|jgi:hypothetical protein
MIIGGLFAFLLITESVFVFRKAEKPVSAIKQTSKQPAQQEGQIAGASVQEGAPPDALADTSNWKTYQDPVYHFSIKYPPDWASPVAKQINDPDFDYVYQTAFGTAETISENGSEGFNIFIFPTEKCAAANDATNTANDSSLASLNCATHKSQISTDTNSQQKILEFSSKVYTYTLVPYIQGNSPDQQLANKTNLEFNEAGKTFSFDSTLQPIAQSSPKKPTAAKPVTAKPISSRPSTSAGRSGKLTGAVSSGGKLVCPHPNRKPTKSPSQGKHVDEDCCPDPDEYPNAACAYKPSDYSIMLKVK